ncbi:uncharacterized protein LOC126273292 [Schistocerca gregaria]|uniref:uncharacterized protein LOC126273292 n=1 Tax=Schistocerca gregaria TaxID=7010 RepID=UPI00211E6605|nr:uncharacterized protein LOC126273292 [Schistocerca gregaria]
MPCVYVSVKVQAVGRRRLQRRAGAAAAARELRREDSTVDAPPPPPPALPASPGTQIKGDQPGRHPFFRRGRRQSPGGRRRRRSHSGAAPRRRTQRPSARVRCTVSCKPDMKLSTLPVSRSIHIKTNFTSVLQIYNISAHSRFRRRRRAIRRLRQRDTMTDEMIISLKTDLAAAADELPFWETKEAPRCGEIDAAPCDS